jgi:GLPGLI family protein
MKRAAPIKLLLLVVLFPVYCYPQIKSGKIVYERKTNLYKKFKDDDVKDWIKEGDKVKTDFFELYFNDSLSCYKPQESDLRERYGWATNKNTVYQNFKSDSTYTIKKVWEEPVHIYDSLHKRNWKITDSKRNISGYVCRKAIWEINDSTRVYAWYTDVIITSTGPENFFGLPGAILGLATEDGGVVYFAKSVEAITPDLASIIPPKTKQKKFTHAELRSRLEKEFGNSKWGKATIKEVMGYW